MMLTSEFDKEKALMAQKIGFYEMTDKTMSDREKSFQDEISRIKEETSVQFKSINHKNRETVDKLENEVKILNQRFTDALDDIKDL